MSENATLGEFDSETASESRTVPTIDSVSLPDRDFEWADETRQILDCLTIVEPAEPVSFPEGGKLTEHQVGYVVDGLEAYRSEYGDKQVAPPSTYKNANDEFDPYIGRLTTRHGSGSSIGREHWGTGIPAERAVQAIRVATGGGNYSTDDLSITGCGRRAFIVEYGDDAFVVAPSKIGNPDRVVTTREFRGLTVENEEDDTVFSGLEIIMDVLEESYDITLTAFSHRTESSLYFETDTGKSIRLKGGHLAKATTPERDPNEILGSYEHETWFTNETYSYEIAEDDLRALPGEKYGPENDKHLLGYTTREKRISRGRFDDRYGAGVRVIAQPYYLTVDEGEDSISTRVYGSNAKDRVACFAYETPDAESPESISDPNLRVRC